MKKLCWNQALKPPRTSRTSTPKLENIRSRIIQTICLDPKVCENQAQRSENIIKSQISEALQIQASKAPKNFYHKPSNTKNIWSRIIQTTYLDLKVHWNQAWKPLETSTNHKSVKLYGFKPLKLRRTSTTNLRRQERTKNTKNAKNKGFLNKLIARDSL